MTGPYYADDRVRLYLGDCRQITAWLDADVLVTDPPYGIGWRRGTNRARAGRKGVTSAHAGIAGDADTCVRDAALAIWGARAGLVFGSFYAPAPAGARHVLVWRKPPGAGLVGATTGWRRDLEPIYVLTGWPARTATASSLITTTAPNAGGPASPAARAGHPHAKPLDVMEHLITGCPPGAIADPFAGSGTTLLAARNLGRTAIGVEIEERYAEIAARRLAQGCLDLTPPLTGGNSR